LTARRRRTPGGRLTAAIALSAALHLTLVLVWDGSSGGGADRGGRAITLTVLDAAGRAPHARDGSVLEPAGGEAAAAPVAATPARAARPARGEGRPSPARPPVRRASRTAAPEAGGRIAGGEGHETLAVAPPAPAGGSRASEGAAEPPGGRAPAGGAARGSTAAGTAGLAGNGGGGAPGGDLRPFCRSCPVPGYPARARRQGWQGTVDVRLRVSGDGTVAEASVARSSGHAVLDAAAVSVARRSRFRVPAGGASLRGQLRYRFVLEEAGRPL
jgi:protein TonB